MFVNSNKIIRLLVAVACILIGAYYSIGALGDTYHFNPLYPYTMVSILILSLIFNQGKTKSLVKGIIPFIVFIAYGALTLGWTQTYEYGYTKIINLFALNIFFIGSAKFIVKDFYRFNLYLVLGLCLCIILLYIGVGSPGKVLAHLAVEGRFGGQDSVGIIGIARFLGFANLCICYLFIKTKSNFKKGILVTIFILSSVYMFFSGTRGAIYGFVLAFIFILYFSTNSAKKRWKNGLGILSVSLFLLFFFDNIASDVLNNFVTSRINSESGSIRIMIFVSTIEAYMGLNLFSFIFGAGSGSASKVVMESIGKVSVLGYQRLYPHNIILEVLYEYGIIGLILFYKVCISPFLLNLRELKANSTTIYLTSFWIFWFFNSLVSSDIMGNFLLFGISIVLMVNYYSKDKLLMSSNIKTY